MGRVELPEDWDDNPEWTEETQRRSRPAAEVLGPELAALLVRKPGRPAGSTKEQVSLRLDKALVAKMRATGPGWQTRANEMLWRAFAAE